ncbi:MAG: NIPSNAP family protein [Tannerella sp.]|jgi:hypothetical protein|nr:NIPSNAP family protein [Tannerella sp.]
MKRRNFLQMSGLLAAAPAVEAFAACTNSAGATSAKNIYEWKIYTLTSNGHELDEYYSRTLIPALKKLNVKTGAFKLLKPEEHELRYILHVYNDWDAYRKAKSGLCKDENYLKAAQPFFEATAPKPVYTEYQTFLCEAFDKYPTLIQPSAERTLLEFRNYKSPNEEANWRKIKMFETEEVALFDKVGVHSVCYGNVIAGPRMPSLIYLTWGKNEDTRNEAWKQFSSSQEWQTMRVKPEYANTATDNKVVLLSPLDFSEI